MQALAKSGESEDKSPNESGKSKRKYKKPRLLVIASDDCIRQNVVEAGKQEKFAVRAIDNGNDALELLVSDEVRPFELIIVQHSLPDISGDQLCRDIRRHDLFTPILVISSKNSEIDLVLSLETGADDYLEQPFGLPVLIAKSRALLRRARLTEGQVEDQVERDNKVVKYKSLSLFPAEHIITKDGIEIPFSRLEYELIKLFIENPKMVWSRDKLLDRVWGLDYVGGTRTVDVHIRWIREKVEDDPSAPKYIKTVRGFGYRFS